jgi:hypothetical protein
MIVMITIILFLLLLLLLLLLLHDIRTIINDDVSLKRTIDRVMVCTILQTYSLEVATLKSGKMDMKKI